MATEKSKLIVLEPCTKSVEDLLALIQEKGQADIVRTQTAEEATQLVVQLQPCMLVACIQENGEVPSRVNLLKRLEPVIKKGLLKSFITSKLKNRQLSTLITSFGVTDFIEEPAPVRTMQFKANLQIKAVETIRKQQEAKKQSQEQIVFKKSDAKKGDEAAVGQDAGAKLKPALELEQDAFLFKNSGVKKVGKKFVVELEGPDPSTGEWVPHEDKGDAKSAWRWMPKEEDGGSKPADGEGWVHEGDKPEFKEASGKWQFASEKPDLSFRKKDEKIATKLSVDEKGELQVAEDSPTAEENVKKTRELARRKKEKGAAAKGKIETQPPGKTPEEIALGKAGKGPDADDLARRLGAGVGESQAEAEARAQAAFHNQTGGEKDGPEGEFNELKAGDTDTPTEFNGLAPAEGDAEAKKPISPLEFLQKKKKEKALNAAARLGEGIPEETSGAPEAIAKTGPEADTADPEKKELPEITFTKPTKQKKSAAEAAQEALARMKAKLGQAGSTDKDSTSGGDAVELGQNGAGEEDDSSEKPELPFAEEAPTEKPESNLPFAAAEEEKVREKAAKLEIAKKEKKRAILAQVQDILEEALPTELPPAEEERLRRKHQPEGADPLPPKELARKERLSRVKELKDRLANLDEELLSTAEEEATHNVHDLRTEEENTASLKGMASEQRRGSMRAFDSDDKPEPDQGDGQLGSSRDKKEAKKRLVFEEKFVYLPEGQLTPAGAAWEKAGDEYYAFLPAEVRYRGFDKLDDLLPFWVFRGEQVPELLDKTKQWRFLARLPSQVKTVAEIPTEVREFLLALRDQIRQEKAAKREEDKNSPDGGDQAESLKELFAENKKKTAGDALADKLDRLKAGLSDESEAHSGDPEKIRAENESAAESEDFLEEDERDGEASDTGAEDFSPKKKRSDANQALEDKLASLKAQLGEDEFATDSAADGKTADSEATPPPDSSLEKLSKSAAFQAFQERRKKKVREEKPAVAPIPTREPYLGIYVALSNAIGQSGEFEKSLYRVLAAIEGSFGACTATLLHPTDPGTPGQARVRVTTGSVDASQPIDLSEGAAFPITQEDGAGGEILGYLFLKTSGDRAAFEPGETSATRKAAVAPWPVLITEARLASEGKEAA